MPRVLVIRGGAVGDMIVTLPALGGLRAAWPQATIDLLGHPERGRLARHPQYVDQVMALERWDMYRLLSPSAVISKALAAYLHRYTLILSYLPVPDATFVTQLQRYCQGEVRSWSPHPPADRHITEHLLQSVCRDLAPSCAPRPRVYLEPDAEARVARFWETAGLPADGVVAWHLGSGGAYKLWPLVGWQQVMAWATTQGMPGVLISGPVEQDRGLLIEYPGWPCVSDFSLPELAALLARCQIVVGHDSGVTHLAAAVGTTVLACFGPTDPYVWGPRSLRACVLWPQPSGPLTLDTLAPDTVIETLQALVQGRFTFTPSHVDCTILRL